MGQLLAQLTVNGLLVGFIYALMGAGLTLEFGVLRVVNFGYGALYAVGGYVCYTFAESLGLNFWLALVISFAAIFGLGMLVEKFGFARFRQSELATLVFGVGLMIVGRAAVMLIWGAQGHGITPPISGNVAVWNLTLSYQRVVAAVVSVLAIGLLTLFLRNTLLGKAMRCVSDSKERAELLGINVRRVYMLAMGLGTAMATVAASIVATILVVGPEVDMRALFVGFIIIILAGMGSIPGALLGGLIIGLVESYAMGYLDVTWGTIIPFAILVLVLIVRPQGLFGKRERIG